MQHNPIVIIGAGIGGLSAAALLAARGEGVLVLERAPASGGKMRQIRIGERAIDGGPTVLTMRWAFDAIFADAGETLDDHVRLVPLPILARHAWGADQRLDLFADMARSADAIGSFAGAAEARRFLAFSAEAARIYRTLRKPFIESQRPSPWGLAVAGGVSGLGGMLRINPFETLWKALGRHFTDPRLRQLFARYSTYCGSSPFAAPATLMLIAHVEQDGVWSVDGGMHALAKSLEALAIRRGAAFRHEAEVSEIMAANDRVSGVRLRTGEEIAASAVIANADAAALGGGLFGSAAARGVAAVPAEARSLSAVTWAAVARTSGFPLTRHNVFFSGDYEREFRELARGVASDPTVYVCAQDRDGACDGPERLLMLVNAPAHGDVSTVDIKTAEQAMRRRIDACGLAAEWQPQDCVMTNPAGFARLFPATGGALYGRASHGWMASFRRPGAATALPGLYLAGGSVHPGPGVPMAALSGRLAMEQLLGDRASTRTFHPGATAGGTSTRSVTMAATD